MTYTKIDCLKLENFKCHRALELDFRGRSASIFGDNATGKTSVYDAMTWLLFGKDSHGNTDKITEIKPIDQAGNTNKDTITSVEACLLTDGVPVRLKRSIRESWVTKRGHSDPVYDGNVCDYAVDGVPVKKAAFDSAVSRICQEDEFKLLTSVSYFADDLHWTKRRGILFDMVGRMTDREIMNRDPRFSELADAVGSRSLDDYRKILSADRKQHSGLKSDIPVRINELERTIQGLSEVDFQKLESELALLQAESDRITAELNGYGADQAARDKQELDRLDIQISRKRDELRALELKASEQDSLLSQARERWKAIDREQFTGQMCPTCGQELPHELSRDAFERFQNRQNDRKHEVEETAHSIIGRRDESVSRASTAKDELQRLEAQAESLRAAVSDQRVGIESGEALRQRLSDIRYQISQKSRDLSGRDMIAKSRDRIQDLQQEARAAAERIEQIDRMLFLADEFIRFKARFVEDSVNSLFNTATFRLFREQANGGLEERCDVVFNGVPFNGLNSGAKINVGIDICSVLSRHFGACVPLFVDNAESVTHISRPEGQMIRLIVSEQDKILRVEEDDL